MTRLPNQWRPGYEDERADEDRPWEPGEREAEWEWMRAHDRARANAHRQHEDGAA